MTMIPVKKDWLIRLKELSTEVNDAINALPDENHQALFVRGKMQRLFGYLESIDYILEHYDK